MLGLFAFFYATLHLLTYVVLDQGLAFEFIIPDILKRPYITMGMIAFTLLVPLAITSTKGWIRRLGKKWQLLHRLVYSERPCRLRPLPVEGQGSDRRTGLLRGHPGCAPRVPAAVAVPADGPAAPGRGWGFRFLTVRRPASRLCRKAILVLCLPFDPLRLPVDLKLAALPYPNR